MDFSARLIHHHDATFTLSTREAALLRYLVDATGRDLSRGEIYRQVWGYAEESQSRTLDITIARLRKKIETRPERPAHLLTLPGIGYRFELTVSTELQPTEPNQQLIGRDEELSELCSLFDEGPSLLSIVGPPGIGKDALACELSRLRPGLAVLDSASAAEIGELRRVHPQKKLIATARSVRRLQGEHIFVVGPLRIEHATEMLTRELCQGIPSDSEFQQLRRVAETLEGNPQLITEFCQSLLARMQEGGWATSLQFLNMSQWIETRVLSWKGAFRASLEEDFSSLGRKAQSLLGHLSRSTHHFTAAELLASESIPEPNEGVDLLQELAEVSALRHLTEHRLIVPLPMRTYVRVKNAERAAATTLS